jgi:hypothetical protein
MKLKLLSLLLFGNILCYSQMNNINKFLDDGGRTEATDIIKTDFSEILQANVPVIWEHKFTKYFAMQGGVGLLTHSFLKPLIRPLATTTSLNPDLKGGFSLYFQPVLYSNGFESYHIGLPVRYRQHGSQASSFEVTIGIGKQWFLGRHFALDLETGVGMNYEYSLDGKSYIYNTDIFIKNLGNQFRSRVVVPISIKLGYVL